MNNEFYEAARGHTNASEQTNWKSNALGIHLTLLDVIQKYATSYKLIHNWLLTNYRSLILDQQDVDQYITREKHGIHH